MRITEHVELVRDILNDPNKMTYDDALIVRHTDQQARRMFRVQVEEAKEFQNFTFGARDSAARKFFNNIWDYRLPDWVYAVADVFTFTPGDTDDTNLSPYVWTSAESLIQAQIPKSRTGRGMRWTWQGHHTVRVWNAAVAPNLLFLVAKTPARMFKGSISTVHTVADKLYMPATLTFGSSDLTEGSFVNAEVIVSSTNSATADQYGEMRRVVASNADVNVSSTRQYELTFEYTFPAVLAVGDVVETLLPIDTEHARLLALCVANACFDQNADLPGKRSIAAEMAEEWRNYHHYAVGQRDSAGPAYWVRGNRRTFARDQDRIGWP